MREAKSIETGIKKGNQNVVYESPQILMKTKEHTTTINEDETSLPLMRMMSENKTVSVLQRSL